MYRLAALFRGRLLSAPSAGHVGDRTWHDLDMDAVFGILDRTSSVVGAQTLYDRLRRPQESEARLTELNQHAEAFAEDSELRTRYYEALSQLSARHVTWLADMLWTDAPPPFRRGGVFLFLALLPALLGSLVVLWPRLLIAVLGAFGLNLIVRAFLRTRIDAFMPALRSLPAFVRCSEWCLGANDEAFTQVRDRMSTHSSSLRYLSRATRWISFNTNPVPVVMGPFFDLALAAQEYISTFFLLDIIAFQMVATRVATHQDSLRSLFLELGGIDTALAVASIREGYSGKWCRPQQATASRNLTARSLVHPLLENAIANDVMMNGRSWLVTGSNMSGKSTLLRTLGVNAILARALGTAFATEWNAPALNVRSVLRKSDSLVQGKSYYLAEVEAVKELLEASRSSQPHLFILDEPFHGTNTVERIAAARGVLVFLDKSPHLVVVATHDVDLVRYLGAQYEAHHFTEQITDGRLLFDYHLRPGVTSTRNAIALLAAENYPKEVIQLAQQTVTESTSLGRLDG